MTTPPSSLACIEQAHEALGLTYAEIASALSADESTVHRWRSGAKLPSPVIRPRLAALDDLLAALRSVFGSGVAGRSTAQRCLDRPHALCGNRPPRATFIDRGAELLLGAAVAAHENASRGASAVAPLEPQHHREPGGAA